MLRRTAARSAWGAAGVRKPMREVLMLAQPYGGKEWSIELGALDRLNVKTAGCWLNATKTDKAQLQKVFPADVFDKIDKTVKEGLGLSPSSDKTLLVLFGSQTGTAEAFARMMSMSASTHGYIPHVCSMNDGIAYLNSGKKPAAVLFICSTYGTGEFPSNAKRMADALKSGSVRVGDTPYAVFGLGNSKNDNFNAAAKSIESALKGQGAKSITRTQLSCELSPNGHEPAFRQWKKNLWAALGCETQTGKLPTTYTAEKSPTEGETKEVVPSGYVNAKVATKSQLTPNGYVSPHYSLRFSLTQDEQLSMLGRKAEITDQVLVMPHNSVKLVERAAKILRLNADEVVHVYPMPGAIPSAIDNQRVSLRTILREVVDLSCQPTRSLLEALALATTDSLERTKLEDLASNLSPGSEYEKRAKTYWTIVDVLEEFKGTTLSVNELLSHWPRIQPRTYSLSTDPSSAATGTFEITFGVATIKGADGTMHHGLATRELENHNAGETITLQLVPGSHSVPPTSVDTCFIALGTGIAPVRANLQARAAAKARGEKIGNAVLYYGFRHTKKDDIFSDEIKGYLSSGVLTNYVGVASHDTDKFVTPMDKMDDSLGDFVGTTGHVLYCGLGGSVPVYVENALRKHRVDVGALRAQGRYHEEYFTPDRDMENLLASHSGADAMAKTLAARVGRCDMFCFQCEQTFQNKGCSKVGVCGKTPKVAALQDLTIHAVKVLGFYLHELRQLKIADDVAANRLTLYSLFTTLTNVNFDETRFVVLLKTLQQVTTAAEERYKAACAAQKTAPKKAPAFSLPAVLPGVEGLVEMGKAVGVLTRFTDEATQNVQGVNEMLMYGLKGIAAYTDHSLVNNMENPAIYAFVQEALAHLVSPASNDMGKSLGFCLKAGECNVQSMALLYKSNSSLGVPKPTHVPNKPVPGKCILISGHDLIMLKDLLERTEPLGINVYTHGEMLPAHSYPELKKYKTLVGNFGGAWMRQSVEFPHFPGPILLTTNCLTEPQDSYRSRVFTAGAVGWQGVPHVGDKIGEMKWDAVIRAAQEAPGFTSSDKEFAYADPVGCRRPPEYVVGFGHETILSVAPTIIEEIKKGTITRFFVVGGCDGFEGQRSYYTELVRQLPKTCVILTVGCGKYRLNHLELGTIGDTGIPRLLDMGQCNDSFSAVQVALALADVLKCKVSDLPLSIVLSWFEQKAIAVLLSCLSLGLKPIHVGPSLPAFLTPDVLSVLVKDFGIRVCGDPEKDMKEMLAAKGAS